MNIHLLANIPLFSGLSHEVLTSIGACMTMLEVPPDTVLIREGELGNDLYVVVYGQLEIIKALGTAEQRLIAIRGPGEFVGELGLVNAEGRRTASARSRGPTQLWRMSYDDFNTLLRKQLEMSNHMVRTLGIRLMDAHNLTIQDLFEKNQQLQEAYDELKAAHEQIVEKERMERELQVAWQIQMSILPQELPAMPGYDFGAYMTPARAVGGDFYDIFQLDDRRVGIVIGDVADKGVPSALFMAQAHALIRAEAQRRKTPHEVLQRVNALLIQMGATRLFVTVLYGVLNVRSNKFSYARAGHELPLLCRKGGQLERISWSQGQPLGLLENPKFDVQTLALRPDSTLLLYTDGVTDGRNPHGKFFGLNAVGKTIQAMAGNPAQEVCDRLSEQMTAFQASAVQDDDVTLVAVSRGGS